MTKIILVFLSYIFIFFNSNLLGSEKVDKNLKIGLLAPFSGEYKNLGESILFSAQLALEEIDDENIEIIPRDSGSNNPELLIKATEEIINSGAKIIIGPTDSKYFGELAEYKDTIFISLSNMQPEITNNIISIGISLESQISALEDLIINKNKTKTIIMYPKNEYTEFVDQKIKLSKLKNYKIFKYSSDPKILTGEISKLTNYTQRKRNLELRKKMFEDKEDEESVKELERLEQLYTLGDVNFDSVIIIDFGNNLKSVLTSLVYTDVNQKNVLFTTVNQWFDESIFYENTIKDLYYPSVNFKEFNNYNVKFFKKFNVYPNEITILTYDALGLIYYTWKKNGEIKSINDFSFKNKIKGKIGTFSFKNQKVIQELDIYKTDDKKFIKF